MTISCVNHMMTVSLLLKSTYILDYVWFIDPIMTSRLHIEISIHTFFVLLFLPFYLDCQVDVFPVSLSFLILKNHMNAIQDQVMVLSGSNAVTSGFRDCLSESSRKSCVRLNDRPTQPSHTSHHKTLPGCCCIQSIINNILIILMNESHKLAWP